MNIRGKNKIISIIFLFISSAFALPPGDRDKYALIIIDMQEYFVTRGGNHELPDNDIKVKELLNKQIQLISLAKKAGLPIIFIEYENRGDSNKKLSEAVKGYQNFKRIIKSSDGMLDSDNWYKSILLNYLHERKIGSLVIAGANGGSCVDKSISGSLSHNYNVVAYKNGIADFNYEKFIYPYENLYSYTLNCENCSFKEVDDLALIALTISMKTSIYVESLNEIIDNSSRGFIKPTTKEIKLKQRSRNAIKQ